MAIYHAKSNKTALVADLVIFSMLRAVANSCWMYVCALQRSRQVLRHDSHRDLNARATFVDKRVLDIVRGE